jgi:PTH1 family peptidyl-tRNA hydrolase
VAVVRLVVGLGNPGPRYAATRHNVGAVWVEGLAQRFGVALREEARFKGRAGRGDLLGHDVRLLLPSTFMNLSGESVGPYAHFHRIETAGILVAYDEMAFEPGVVRLKLGGGDNGHNGIRDVIRGLGNEAGFLRLRIGVGHPGDRDRVTGHLTGERLPASEREVIERALAFPDAVLDDLLAGNLARAMNVLHAERAGEN